MSKKVLLSMAMTLFAICLLGQASNKPDAMPTGTMTKKRSDNYRKLKNLGYTESAIFEDLGNVNFLTQNYAAALFWYKKLMDYSVDGTLSKSYSKRYSYALAKIDSATVSRFPANEDWLSEIKEDYGLDTTFSKHPTSSPHLALYTGVGSPLQKEQRIARNVLAGSGKNVLTAAKLDSLSNNNASIAITADGNTVFFTKAVKQKPLHGIFSKKEWVHRLFRANKLKGQWKNIQEVVLCPIYSSIVHPTVSFDGKRLFFASNMPGTYGNYDIYVARLNSDGSLGVAKNLGNKVNSKKNELYPNIVDTNMLFFASERRGGYGGLDVFMAKVDQNHVGQAVNLGSSVNSGEDDFLIRPMGKIRLERVPLHRENKTGDAPPQQADKT